MSNLLRISEATSIALHTTALLARYEDSVVTTPEIAAALGVSEAHLSKVLQRLAKFGLVSSARGPKGGFSLARSADAITLLDVYEAMEGPLKVDNCLLSKPVCGNKCIMGDILMKVNALVRDRLTETKVSEVAGCVVGGVDA